MCTIRFYSTVSEPTTILFRMQRMQQLFTPFGTNNGVMANNIYRQVSWNIGIVLIDSDAVCVHFVQINMQKFFCVANPKKSILFYKNKMLNLKLKDIFKQFYITLDFSERATHVDTNVCCYN